MLSTIVAILLHWNKVFPQQRTTHRAIKQSLSSLCVIGRRTIARSYLVQQDSSDWSSQYKLHSRCRWQPQDLFDPIFKDAIQICQGKLLPLGTDDTRLRKTGKHISSAHWGRDPLSPPFHLNLQYGLRFLHTSVLLPLHENHPVSARALPVFFQQVTPLKKPGKRATPQQKQAYRQAVKQRNLSTEAVGMMKQLRQKADRLGGQAKTLAFAMDGSFCNRTVFKAELERTILIARCRKDAKLCWPLRQGRRLYSKEVFTPDQVLKDQGRPWQQTAIFHGGKMRKLYYKEVKPILWRPAGARRELRLLVVRPTPYRKSKKGRMLYRQPAYLLTTDLETQARKLVQIYFDRWQVEVAHKELKDNFGLGQAQVRVEQAVARQPVMQVATYSAMHLAALKVYGAQRPTEFGPLPKYQRDKSRASCQEMIRQIRNEVVNKAGELPFELRITEKSILAAATI
ncbi:MAG TPA: transposase [Pyrinomonadaceae bacterium]|nr:transposase [Pyrinomonadaceae bacterium]